MKSGSKFGIDTIENRLANSEGFRGWPPLIKMAVKAKVEKLLNQK